MPRGPQVLLESIFVKAPTSSWVEAKGVKHVAKSSCRALWIGQLGGGVGAPQVSMILE